MRTTKVAAVALAAAMSFLAVPATAEGEDCLLPKSKKLDVGDLPAGSLVEACDAVGRVVSNDGVGVIVPRRGGTSIITVDGPAGGGSFGVHVTDRGRVEYLGLGRTDAAPAAAWPTGDYAAGQDPCKDNASVTYPARQYGDWEWHLGPGDIPAGLNRAEFWRVSTDAIDNITDSYNKCGYPDTVPATAAYGGTVPNTVEVGIGPQGETTCGESDGVSVIDAGFIPGDLYALAVTCLHIWERDGYDDIGEADMRVDTVRYDFTVNPMDCSREYDLEAVMTHEAGHVFGLSHVSERTHPELTMSEETGDCDPSARTLGRGDVVGPRKLY